MWIALTIMSTVSLTVSCIGTGAVLRYLKKRQILDRPNERSNHTVPTPRGGGIAVTGTILAFMLSASFSHDYLRPDIYLVIGCALLLGLISWRDDRKPVAARWRFLAQIACVAASLHLLFPDGLLLQGLLPPLVDKLITAFLWLWFINLYNFMDGIDGITAAETTTLCAGIMAVTLLAALPPQFAFHGALIGSATLGFAYWNRHPAKIFLGDVGSIPLGYLLGWLLLSLAYAGQWAAAFILPLYYFADSGLTLLNRARKGEKLWQAHSQHFYQQAVRAGKTHTQVVARILTCNIVLVALAIASAVDAGHVWVYIAAALAVVAALLFTLKPKHA